MARSRLRCASNRGVLTADRTRDLHQAAALRTCPHLKVPRSMRGRPDGRGVQRRRPGRDPRALRGGRRGRRGALCRRDLLLRTGAVPPRAWAVPPRRLDRRDAVRREQARRAEVRAGGLAVEGLVLGGPAARLRGARAAGARVALPSLRQLGRLHRARSGGREPALAWPFGRAASSDPPPTGARAPSSRCWAAGCSCPSRTTRRARRSCSPTARPSGWTRASACSPRLPS